MKQTPYQSKFQNILQWKC